MVALKGKMGWLLFCALQFHLLIGELNTCLLLSNCEKAVNLMQQQSAIARNFVFRLFYANKKKFSSGFTGRIKKATFRQVAFFIILGGENDYL